MSEHRHSQRPDHAARTPLGLPSARGHAALDVGARPRAAADARTWRSAAHASRRCRPRAAGPIPGIRPTPRRSRERRRFLDATASLCGSASSIRASAPGRRERPDATATGASPTRNGARIRCSTGSARPTCSLADHMLRARRCGRRARRRSRRSSCASPRSAFVDAMSPSNFAFTNPLVLEKTIETRRRKPAQGPGASCSPISSRGSSPIPTAARSSSAATSPTTPGKVIQRNAALPAHPVCADDARRARDAAGHLPAVDQPLLHPRSQRRRRASSAGRSSRG